MTESEPQPVPVTSAVYDAMVFLQALGSGRGPAAACFALADAGHVRLWASDLTLRELGGILNRPSVRQRFPRLTDELVYSFMLQVTAMCLIERHPPRAVALPRDPKDEPYLDLAAAVRASFLVTWNHRHLGYLMEQNTPEGKEFCVRFPWLAIVDPVAFLRDVEARLAARQPPP